MQAFPKFRHFPAGEFLKISLVYSHRSLFCGVLYAITDSGGGKL